MTSTPRYTVINVDGRNLLVPEGVDYHDADWDTLESLGDRLVVLAEDHAAAVVEAEQRGLDANDDNWTQEERTELWLLAYAAGQAAGTKDTVKTGGNTAATARVERQKRLCGCGHMLRDHSIDDMCSLCDCENITREEDRSTE